MKYPKLMTIQFISLLFFGLSCSEYNSAETKSDAINNSTRIENDMSSDSTKTNNKMTNYFPFKIIENTGQFLITAETESPELYPKYAEFFEKFQYSGNGYCWEGHIKQILEELKPDLLKHITFDPEAGAFIAIADTKENQLKFVELLSPIFADLKKLEEYVKKANHSKIDD